MDPILSFLQGKAFNLPVEAFNFLSDRREELIKITIPNLEIDGFSPDIIEKLISLHRSQLESQDYLMSRVDNPTTGTIDHIHAEITAFNCVNLASSKGYSIYAQELLRAAGHLHDSERSYPRNMSIGEAEVRENPEGYKQYKLLHASNSVDTANRLLEEIESDGCVFPSGFQNDLNYLILRHELGGEKKDGVNIFKPSEFDLELNMNDLNDILTYADSFSYIDANILTNWEESNRNINALSLKVRYMFDRMTDEGKNIVLENIINSKDHLLGVNSPDDADITAIRKILLQVCLP